MSKKYTPTNWVANKTVATADVMNNIEKGIEDAHQDIEILDSQIKETMSQLEHIENKITSINISSFKLDTNTWADAYYLALESLKGND